MYTHTEHPENLTEHAEPVELVWQDPHEQILSDDETAPVKAWRRLHTRIDNHEKWRLYRREFGDDNTRWYVMQPSMIDKPMFGGGMFYGYSSSSGADALRTLQLAMAKAAA